MKRLALIGLVLAGCKGADTKLIPFLGTWSGQFTVEKVGQGPDTEKDRKRHSLTGFLRIQLNLKQYQMELKGEQQLVKITGTWTYTGKQIVLTPGKVEIKEESDDGPNPNYKFVPAEDLNKAYQQKLAFTVNEKGTQLVGRTTSISFLTGTHAYKKD